MASAKACDAVYKVSLPLTARLIRELQYDIFYVTDHATHFYALAAPDFVMGPTSDPAERNLIGVIRKLGVEVGRQGHPGQEVGPRGGGDLRRPAR